MKTYFDSNDNQFHLIEEKDIEFTEQYLKLPNGFMMVYMYVTLKEGVESGTFNFPIPFKQVYRTFASHTWASETFGYASIGRTTLTSVDVLLSDLNNGISKERNGIVIAIGRWK